MKYIFHWIAILCIFVLVLVLIQPDNKENFENVNEFNIRIKIKVLPCKIHLYLFIKRYDFI